MSPKTATPPSPPEFYTTDQLATRLGLARQSLYQMRHDGRGPKFVKIGDLGKRGARVLYRSADVDAWIEANTVDPSAQTA